MVWMDVTAPLAEGMTVWPGDAPFRSEQSASIARGDGSNRTLLHLETHTGTHFDAPAHLLADGATLDHLDPALFFGEAVVVSISERRHVLPSDLPPGLSGARVLFRTLNSDEPEGAPFREDFCALDAATAEALAEAGARLVGVDGLSVDPFDSGGLPAHHALLGRDIPIIEGLRLGAARPGRCAFVALPLALTGTDGAPCRAFLAQENAHA
jgi:arylformamidase